MKGRLCGEKACSHNTSDVCLWNACVRLCPLEVWKGPVVLVVSAMLSCPIFEGRDWVKEKAWLGTVLRNLRLLCLTLRILRGFGSFIFAYKDRSYECVVIQFSFGFSAETSVLYIFCLCDTCITSAFHLMTVTDHTTWSFLGFLYAKCFSIVPQTVY